MSRTSVQTANPEAQLQHYSQTAIPTALMDLSGKHQYVNQVIQYCEQSYATQNKNEIEQQTKNYLTDALEAVVKVFELIAANLTQFVELQGASVSSLTSQLDMLRTRMELAREHQAYNRLNQMRRERTQTMPVPTGISKTPAVRYLQGEELPEEAAKMEAFTRVPLAARMAALDEVGICLRKEEAVRTDFSTPMSSAPMTSPAMLSKTPSMGPGSFPTMNKQPSYGSQGSAPPPSPSSPPVAPGPPPAPVPYSAPAPPPAVPGPPPAPIAHAPPPPPVPAPGPPPPPAGFGGPPAPPAPPGMGPPRPPPPRM